MSASSLPPYTFTHVHIYRRNHVWLGAVGDELSERGVDHALMLRYLDGAWGQRSVGSAVVASYMVEEPGPKLLNLTPDGRLLVFTLPGTATEVIDASDEGPSDLLNMRGMRFIGSHIYVAGMARRVYRRDAPNSWVAIDQGVFVPRAQRRTAVGFNDIDGRSEHEIYAVGYKGEIWFYNGNSWRQEESPTNVALTALVVMPEGDVYACGMAGLIVTGRSGQWRIVSQEATSNDFWGTTYFGGQIYLSGYDGVYCLYQDVLTRVDMNLERSVSTAYLHANDGVLWSVGHKDISATTNGVDWSIVPKR
jgi:hypothetical protein